MQAQNWKQEFDDEVTRRAKSRHQQALVDAHEAYKQAEAEAWAERNAEYERASAQWDEVKSRPDAPDYERTREAFDRAKEPPTLATARKALAQAISKADEEYHSEVRRLAQEHSVTVQ